ncbi:Octanoate-[acyl-carrier-protein]-protein-N-octan oyltransferase [uncultured Candidatus Thioglobus sp.]|nr:Octanoate-[acyl-carrier-protein]-protein-N-octan oyltransferase [uncultured Candidatus Thioglobus sp.]
MKIINLGLQDYTQTWKAMQAFSAKRQTDSEDQLWIVEHPAVFTQGIASKAEHLLKHSNIPVVDTDRGGQITYHAPGQLIIYCLIDLKRLGIGVKKMVSIIETSIIDLLNTYDIQAELKKAAPGVYVKGAKIAALGLKVKKGRTYHGLSLNIDMDLSPFTQINPCGYQGLKVTQLSELTNTVNFEKTATALSGFLAQNIANSVKM